MLRKADADRASKSADRSDHQSLGTCGHLDAAIPHHADQRSQHRAAQGMRVPRCGNTRTHRHGPTRELAQYGSDGTPK